MKSLNLKYIPLGLLIIYVIKSLITGAGINEVLLIGILASLIGFYESKINKKEVEKLQEQINKKEVEKLQEQINEITGNIQGHNKIIDDLKSSIVSVKISSGIRGLGNK